MPTITVSDALNSAHAYWEAKGPSSRMMSIRANECAKALPMKAKVDALTPADGMKVLTRLRSLRSERTARPLAKGSIAAYYAAFRRALELAGGDCRRWPKADTPPRKCREPLSEADLDRLAEALHGTTYSQNLVRTPGTWETYDLLELLRGTGLRVDVEALSWDACEWRPNDRTLRVTGKGGHERVIPVERAETVTLLNDAPRLQAMRKLSYSGHLKRWNAAIERLQIASLKPTPHAVRHAYATRVYRQSGKDIRLVQSLLGHADISTTARYLGVDVEAGRQAVV